MREIIGLAGHAALTNGERDPIFDGFTESGMRREYTLSEIPLPTDGESRSAWENRAGFRTTLEVFLHLRKV